MDLIKDMLARRMSSNFLVQVLSEFDINIKYFKINIKNQFNCNYALFYWLLCSLNFSQYLINAFILLFISDEDIDGLKKYGSLGYICGGKTSRFMIDLAAMSFYSLILIVLSNYFIDKMQWILKMSSIYEEIRTKHFDKFLMKSAKKISFYCRTGLIMAIICGDLIVIALFYVKWDQFIDYPIGFIISILTIEFGTKIGFPIVLRQFAIVIFICQMHCRKIFQWESECYGINSKSTLVY